MNLTPSAAHRHINYIRRHTAGFPKGIEGFELTENMEQQARRFGAEIEAETIESIDLSKRPFAMKTASGLDLAADALIIATGASPRHLDIPGYQRLWNKGISTCAVSATCSVESTSNDSTAPSRYADS